MTASNGRDESWDDEVPDSWEQGANLPREERNCGDSGSLPPKEPDRGVVAWVIRGSKVYDGLALVHQILDLINGSGG